jgi:LEA14-like dessication related protein
MGARKRGRVALSYRLGAFAVAAAAAGCAPGIVRELDIVAISGIRILHIDERELALELSVDLRNDRRVGVTVEQLEFDLALTGAPLATGALTRSTRLGGRATATVTVPLTVDCRSLTREDFDALFEPRVPYRLRGGARVATPLGRRDAAVDARGSVASPAQWRATLLDEGAFRLVSLRGAAIKSIGLGTSEGVLGLILQNPFSFELPLKRFEYRVEIDGHVAGEGALCDARELAPGDNRFELPVRAHPVGAMRGAIGEVLGVWLPSPRLRGRLLLGRGERELAVDFEYRVT